MKLIRVLSVVLAAMLLCVITICTATADTDYRTRQLERFGQMKNRTISVYIGSGGGYILKSSKFYAREVTGVAENGDFILGGWKCLDSDTNVPCGNHTINIPGTCVAFAYSCDILWGTDFPYSGVFWNDPFRDVENITISLTGLVRNVDISIRVNGSWVYCDTNCDSHSEWKP